ncbi:glycosyltransferase family 1 protein [Pseudomonas sp.]|uniref:glycosyltransferase family 4 protein n=1 Tax=Pseudomonas sp. TaxID=306 RepID=UPI0028A59E2F|nr:glycosyltransferase family 1 protein [Pseudomonas sp.]
MNTRTLRITLVSETAPAQMGGEAHTLAQLSEGLRRRGHRVEIVRTRHCDEAMRAGPELLLCRSWRLPGYPALQWGAVSMHTLTRRWRRQRPDVLYIATEGPLGLSALRAARRLGIAVVSGYHANVPRVCDQLRLGALVRVLTHYLRWFHRRCAATLVPSVSLSLALQRRGFEHVSVLDRGVDAQLFNPSRRSQALRERWGLGAKDIAVLHVGRLLPEKNLALLAPCWHALQHQSAQRRLRLVIVGDGPYRATLQRQLPDALFCGAQTGEALAEHYASGDLFLFPSLHETFGNVVLEAMASGLAVVAYDQAAAAQHVSPGHSGALAMPGDHRAFIEAACWLLEDSETLRRVRLNARQHASRQSWPAVVEQFESYLLAACHQSARTPLAAGAALAIKPGAPTPRG